MKTFDVPDAIPISKVRAFLTDLGLPLDDLIDLTVGSSGVYVELWARNADGQRYIPPGARDAARHEIAIPLDADT